MSTLEELLKDFVRKALRDELAGELPSTDPATVKAVYTVAEVAQLLRISRKAVFARVSRGQLAGVFRIGRSVRFRGPELLRSLAGGRASSSRST